MRKKIISIGILATLVMTLSFPTGVFAFRDYVNNFDGATDAIPQAAYPTNSISAVSGSTYSKTTAPLGMFERGVARLNVINSSFGKIGTDKQVIVRMGESQTVKFGAKWLDSSGVARDIIPGKDASYSYSVYIPQLTTSAAVNVDFQTYAKNSGGTLIGAGRDNKMIFTKDGGVKWYCASALDGTQTIIDIADSWQPNQWYNFAVKIFGSERNKIYLYIDGVQKASYEPSANSGDYVSSVIMMVGFDFAEAPGTALASNSWLVLEDYVIRNMDPTQASPYNVTQSSYIYDGANYVTALTKTAEAPSGLTINNPALSATGSAPNATITGVPTGSTVSQLLSYLSGQTGGSSAVRAVTFNAAAPSSLTGIPYEDKSVACPFVSSFATTALDASAMVDANTKIASVGINGSIKLYSIELAQAQGGDQSQDAPLSSLFTATAPTAALSDGSISGTTDLMEYKKQGDSSYTAITGTSITGLTAGNYLIRYAAKTGYLASSDTVVTVSEYVDPDAPVPALTAVTARTGISGAVTNSPAENVFKIAGDAKQFILLEKGLNKSNQPEYFVLTKDFYGVKNFDPQPEPGPYDQYKFDPTDTDSVANFLNNDFLTSGNAYRWADVNYPAVSLPQGIINNIDMNHKWWTEPAPLVSNYPTTQYSATCGVALLSQTEYVNYAAKIGNSDGMYVDANNYFGYPGDKPWGWTLRSTTNAVLSSGNNLYAMFQEVGRTRQSFGWKEYFLRPTFYLKDSFFKTVKLDVSTMGSNVKSVITSTYTRADLEGLYSNDELTTLGYENPYATKFYKADGTTELTSMSVSDGTVIIKKDVKYDTAPSAHNTIVVALYVQNADGQWQLSSVVHNNTPSGGGPIYNYSLSVDLTGIDIAKAKIKSMYLSDSEKLIPLEWATPLN